MNRLRCNKYAGAPAVLLCVMVTLVVVRLVFVRWCALNLDPYLHEEDTALYAKATAAVEEMVGSAELETFTPPAPQDHGAPVYDFVTVAFYTPNYRDRAERLMASCREWKVPCTVLPVSDPVPALYPHFHWVFFKPFFFRAALRRFGVPCFFVDVDFEFVGSPAALFGTANRDPALELSVRNFSDGFDTATGSVWLAYNGRVLAFLARWAAMMTFTTNRVGADDQVLDIMLERHNDERLVAAWLPADFWAPWWDEEPAVVARAVLLHDRGKEPHGDKCRSLVVEPPMSFVEKALAA